MARGPGGRGKGKDNLKHWCAKRPFCKANRSTMRTTLVSDKLTRKPSPASEMVKFKLQSDGGPKGGSESAPPSAHLPPTAGHCHWHLPPKSTTTEATDRGPNGLLSTATAQHTQHTSSSPTASPPIAHRHRSHPLAQCHRFRPSP